MPRDSSKENSKVEDGPPHFLNRRADIGSDGLRTGSDGHSTLNRLSGLARRSKAKARDFITNDTSSEEDKDEENIKKRIETDPAFAPGQLVGKKHFTAKGTTDKTLGTLGSIGKSIAHPKTAIKSKATKTTAGQLSKVERPYLSQKADLEFLQAHDNLRRAESTCTSRKSTSEGEDYEAVVHDHRDKIRELEAHRNSRRAAWTTSRHVRRVYAVTNSPYRRFPDKDYFCIRGPDENSIRYDWPKWIGYNLIYYTRDYCTQYIDDSNDLPFDIDSIKHYVERLIMASAAWQSWLMDVRAVYRWENPKTTAKWVFVYIGLWYTEHIMGFTYGYVLYIVLKNRFAPTNVGSLRDSTERALDSQSKSQKLIELIDKHGKNNWLEPVLQDLGPYAQVQLGDLANLLEVLQNFYEWKAPYRTFATLGFFSSCLLVTLLTDMAFCMKIVWFVAGGTFFLCWPIASQYPRYRMLVSPFKWVLWNIPTHAEWSFQYLRCEAQITREELIKRRVERQHVQEDTNPSTNTYVGRTTNAPTILIDNDAAPSDEEDEGWQSADSVKSMLGEQDDIRSFHGFSRGSPGRLVVYSKGIRFMNRVKRTESWRILFVDIVTMRKLEASGVSKLVLSPDQIEIQNCEGVTFRVEGMGERNEAFNTIIAFSGMRFQSLQPRSMDC